MSVDDFDGLLFPEFNSVLEQWRREQRRQGAYWLHGIRLHAAISIAPHCKKAPAPEELFEIPDIDRPATEKLTREERKARYKQLKKQRGYG